MSRSPVKIEGLGELRVNLLRAAAATRAGAAEAIRQEVDVVRQDAQDAAPLGLTGDLREGLVGTTDAAALEGRVLATARHSGFVELGTYKDPAQPYMAPAAERARQRFPVRAGAVIRTALEGIRR